MAPKPVSSVYLDEKSPQRTGRSPVRSPARSAQPNGRQLDKKRAEPSDYTSEGVANNDILKLPSSDWQLLGFLTLVAAVVRLFRIYQPSSVVFDEVQYVTR